MKKNLVCAAILGGMLISPLSAALAEQIQVEVSGSGISKMDALKSAWTEAVRQAVGMYTASKTEVLNDDITEKIAAHSRGQVNSYKVLSETRDNGLWDIKIVANVDKDVLQETMVATQSRKVKIDGASLAAEKQTTASKKDDANKVLQISDLTDFSNCIEFEPNIRKLNINNTSEAFVMCNIRINPSKFKQQSDSLEKLISQIAKSKKTIKLDPQSIKNGLSLLSVPLGKLNVKINEVERLKGVIGKSKSPVDGLLFYSSGNARLESSGATHSSCSGNLIIDDYRYELTESMLSKPVISCLYDGKKIFENFGFGLTDYGQYRDINSPQVCFLKGSSSLSCYSVEQNILNEFSSGNLMTIKSEQNGGYDNELINPLSFEIRIPAVNSKDPNQKQMVVVAPFIGINPEENHIRWYMTPIIGTIQRLDVGVDKLATLKDVDISYSLEPLTNR